MRRSQGAFAFRVLQDARSFRKTRSTVGDVFFSETVSRRFQLFLINVSLRITKERNRLRSSRAVYAYALSRPNSTFLGEDGVFLSAVTAAGLLTTFNAGGVERTADDLVTNAREVANTTAADENDGVFLKFVPFTGDVNGDFFVVRETNTSNTTKSGVRLLGLHGTDQKADAALLRAAFEDRGIRLTVLLFAVFTHQLVNRRHYNLSLVLITSLCMGVPNARGNRENSFAFCFKQTTRRWLYRF